MKYCKVTNSFKRFLSLIVAFVLLITVLPMPSVSAEDTYEKYPYTMFAASEKEGAITINAENACVNGNVATNGTIISSGNMNINGTKTENAREGMLYILKKLEYSYFSGDSVEKYFDDYVYEDLNININNSMDVYGDIELMGSISLNSGIKALGDISVSGNVLNSNNAVVCSETGNIDIDSNIVNYSGLIYAPNGDITINTESLNLNSVVIIAQTITINCPSINANYSSSMAELVGTESEFEIKIYAFGEYNKETNTININWATNYENSTYEILSSDDNVSYTSVSDVTGATSYQYTITDDFEIKYFKVLLTTNYGETVDSIPFVVVKAEYGYNVELLDSDGDGLADIYEIEIGTDVENADTDADGLTDYQEVCITETNPTKYDSVTEGVSDADADSDGDGLSNIQEIEFGTNPQETDTDEDGLSDYDEIYVYGTDPLDPDSDDDGLKDGDEPHIALIPTNPETFDIPDAEYVSSQTISEDSESLEKINTDESPYKLSIEIESTGYVEGNIKAGETSYSKAISNEAILGVAPELICNDSCNISKVVLKFSIADGYINSELNAFPNEPDLQGLKHLTIFKYFEDIGMLLPIETKYDIENNTIYTEVDELGTYCIMDMEKLLISLGIEGDDYSEVSPIMSLEEEEIVKDLSDKFTEEDTRVVFSEEIENNILPKEIIEPVTFSSTQTRGIVTVQTPVDIVFLLQTSGQLEGVFNSQREMIENLMKSLVTKYGDNTVRLCIITYGLNGAEALTLNSNDIWLTSSTDVKAALSSVEYVYTSDYTDRGAAFEFLQNDVVFKPTASKFIIQAMNGSTNVGTSYFDQINTCSKLGINYSELMPSGYYYLSSSYEKRVDNSIKSTGGLNLTYGTDSLEKIYYHIIDNVAPPRVGYNILLGVNLKSIALINVLDPDNGADTDEDDLTDWEEVNTDIGLISWDNNGNIQLPTIKNCMETVNKPYVSYIITYYMEQSYGKEFLDTEILPVHSNPCDEDTDGDGIYDGKDISPKYINAYADKIKEYINKDLIYMKDIEITDDDFLICKTSLADILLNGGVTNVYDNDSDYVDVRDYYDDWFIFLVDNESPTFGLFKMREQEYDQIDGDDPGVTISFVKFHINKLDDIIESGGANSNVFYNEVDNVVHIGNKYNKSLQKYFSNKRSEGAYLIAEAYVEHIAKFSIFNTIVFPENLKKIYEEIININELLNNGSIMASGTIAYLYSMRNKLNRVPSALRDINEKSGKTIVMLPEKKIKISDPNNLDYYEKIAILSAYTADTTFNMFAAEVKAHADYLVDWKVDFMDWPLIGGIIESQWYMKAIRADMGIAEEIESGIYDNYYDLNSDYVQEQIKYHGEY